MEGPPIGRGMSLNLSPDAPGLSRAFIDQLDVELAGIRASLLANDRITSVKVQIKDLCDRVTHSQRDDRVIGVEPNKILNPNWESAWRESKWVLTALFWNHEGVLEGEQAEYLYAVFRELVRFLVDGRTEHLQRRIGRNLRDAIEDYLSVRGYDVVVDDSDARQATVGYLGLRLDERRHVVSRDGHPSLDLARSPLRFALLVKLAHNRDTPTNRDTLAQVWKEHGTDDSPSDSRIDTEISVLRREIAILGLAIGNRRKLGWLLEDRATPKI